MGAILSLARTIISHARLSRGDRLYLPFSSAAHGSRAWTLSRSGRPLGRLANVRDMAAGMYDV